MLITELKLIDDALNVATALLEDARIPVTPDTQYTMLYACNQSLMGRQDDDSIEMGLAINLAMIRLNPSLSIPIVF